MTGSYAVSGATFFQWPDYVVLFLMLAISAAIGIFYACTGGKQKSTKEYLLADGNMHWFPVACSLLASFISTNTLIGVPAEVYKYGSAVFYGGLGYGIGAILSEIFFLPVYEQLGIISVFQYVELRFGRPLKLVVTILSLIQMLLYAAIVIYGPALSIAAVTGINIWVSIFSIAFIAMLYTTVGGLKAVLWTDAFQLSLMLAGMFLVMIYGVNMQEGAFAGVWEAAKMSGRLDATEARTLDFDPRVRNTFWNTLLNGVVWFTGFYGCTQTSVQRYLSLRSRNYKRIAYTFTCFGCILLQTVSVLIGISVFGYFRHCDPLQTGEIFTKDQLYPLYVMKLFGHLPGLPGLLLSALFSASLSTVSSLLSSGSLMILEEFVKPYKKVTDKRATIISKGIAFSMGIAALLTAMIIKEIGGGVLSMAVTFIGMFGGPILGLFIAGLYIPIANTKGAFVGFVTGATYGAVVGVGGLIAKPYLTSYPTTTAGCNVTEAGLANLTSPIFDPVAYDPHPHYRSGALAFFDQSYNWIAVAGCLLTFLIVLVASLFFSKDEDEPVNKALLSPFVLRAGCLMPKKWRAHIDFDSPPLDMNFIEKNVDAIKDVKKEYGNKAYDSGDDTPI